jgi:hypothetical protein
VISLAFKATQVPPPNLLSTAKFEPTGSLTILNNDNFIQLIKLFEVLEAAFILQICFYFEVF